MKPILYSHGETSFTNNGLGRLADCISCVVTEERNGIYECQFTYPVTGEMFPEIQEGRIIAVIHDDAKDIQPFDIYAHSAPLNGVVTFYAHHISYRLGNVILKPMEASSCAAVLAAIPHNTYNICPFTFWTDKVVSKNWQNEIPSAVKAILGGQEGSILDVYGKGDYQWDKWVVRLYTNRGNDNGVSIRYGINLTDLEQEYDESGSYNAVAPYWVSSEDGTVVTLTNGIVAVNSGTRLVPWTTQSDTEVTDNAANTIHFEVGNPITPVPMDLSEAFEEQPTEAQLEAEALRRLNNSEAWLPSENIKVEFVNLADTEEYRNVAALQRVSLCDKVSVYCGPLGVSAVKMQVIRVVYNVLTERYDEIELGKAKVSFAQTITAKIEEVTKDLPTVSMMQRAIDNATDQITGAKGGHLRDIYDANGNRQEMVIMDTEDIGTAVKVWRWNLGGLGYSKNGYSGPYGLAITQDGAIVADFITTGTLIANIIKAGILSDESGKNFWNMETGEFSLSGDVGLGESTVSDVLDAVDAAISNVDVEYAQNQSTTTAPTSGWSTTAPAWRDGYYIWQRTKTTFASGTSYSQPTCISGRDGVDGQTGPTGPQGATGIGVSAVVEQYYLSTSNTTQSGGSWSTSQPEWVSGKYIWTRSQVTWTDTTTTYTTPVLAQAINGANSAASSAQSAVTTLDNSLNQQGVFNRLTNNGQTQGIYLSNGLLYINASYIKTGVIDGNTVVAKLINTIDASNNIIASFNNKITLGLSNRYHVEITNEAFMIIDNSSNIITSIGSVSGNDIQTSHSEVYFPRHYMELPYRCTDITTLKFYADESLVPSSEYSLSDGGTRLYYTVSGTNYVTRLRAVYYTDEPIKSITLGTRANKLYGAYSCCLGINCTCAGSYSLTEGGFTETYGQYAHAEGNYCIAASESAHAEGGGSKAYGRFSHAEGQATEANGDRGHAEGQSTQANGDYSHAQGYYTIANGIAQNAFGSKNIADSENRYIEIVGNAQADSFSNRSNARTLDWSGNEWIAGTLTQASDSSLKEESGEVPDLSDIRARRFKWNDKKGTHDDDEHIGYFAQDVEKLAPYLVKEDAMGYKSLDYIALLCAKVEYLERRVQQLESEVKRHDD